MKNRRLISCLLAIFILLSLMPIMQASAESGWSSNFKNFVLNEDYLSTGLAFATSEYIHPLFSICDIDRDGTPELLIENGILPETESQKYVFSYENGQIRHIGSLRKLCQQPYRRENADYPGIFANCGARSSYYQQYYYELNNGQIFEYPIQIVDNTNGSSSTLLTDNQELYSYALECDASSLDCSIPFYSLKNIREMGWEEFVLRTFGVLEESGSTGSDDSYWFEDNNETDRDDGDNYEHENSGEIDVTGEDNRDVIPVDEQFAANIFLSNFSEQHAFERYTFSADSPYIDDIVNFAYLYCKINRRNMLDTAQAGESYYYTLSLENANTVLNRHFDYTLSEEDAARFPENEDPNSRFHSFYENGTFYFPAADGESYNRFTVVSHIDQPENGDNRYQMYFDIYKLDIQEYMKANGAVDSGYYYLSASQAANDSRLTWENSGVALVKPYNNNGTDTYQLIYYRVGNSEDQTEEDSGPDTTEAEIPLLDRLLQTSPIDYNQELAVLAAELSLATYTGANDSDEAVREKLSELGFENADIYSNNFSGGSLANVVAVKPYNGEDSDGNTDIMVIVARGSVTWHEFYMDHATGAGQDINGYRAYDIVKDFYIDIFKNMYKAVQDGKKYKVLLTGHSLGGAAANLMAASLNNLEGGKENVFCYTFGAIDSIVTDGLVYEGHENIHNVTNFYDSFGPNGRTGFTAKGNTRYGKFGHIDIFFTDLGPGDALNEPNHGMAEVYLPAVKEGIVYHDLPAYRKIISAHCPVDIKVYRDADLVGSVTDNAVDKDVTVIPISVVDDEKYIFIPDDSDYRFELTATDSGNMTFRVSSAATDTTLKVFSDVQLEKGKTFACDVGGSDAADSDIKLLVVDNNGVSTKEVGSDGTEIALKGKSAEMTVQEDALALSKEVPRWIIVVIAVALISMLGLIILLIARRDEPREQGKKASSSRNSQNSRKLPAFSATHCCICGNRLDEQYKVFFKTRDGKEARVDRSCSRMLKAIYKGEDAKSVREAQRYFRSRYDLVDPVVKEHLKEAAESTGR